MLRYSAWEKPEFTKLRVSIGAFWFPGTCVSKEEGAIDRQAMVWPPDSLKRMIDINNVSLLGSYGAEFVSSASGHNVAVDACGGDLHVRDTL